MDIGFDKSHFEGSAGYMEHIILQRDGVLFGWFTRHFEDAEEPGWHPNWEIRDRYPGLKPCYPIGEEEQLMSDIRAEEGRKTGLPPGVVFIW